MKKKRKTLWFVRDKQSKVRIQTEKNIKNSLYIEIAGEEIIYMTGIKLLPGQKKKFRLVEMKK